MSASRKSGREVELEHMQEMLRHSAPTRTRRRRVDFDDDGGVQSSADTGAGVGPTSGPEPTGALAAQTAPAADVPPAPDPVSTQAVPQRATAPARPLSAAPSAVPARSAQAARVRLATAPRQLAVPNTSQDGVKSSVNLSVELLDALDAWRIERRSDFGHRAALSWLIEAALFDFPTDIDGLRALADSLPEELTRVEPAQQAAVLSRETVENLRLAADVLRGRRAKGIKLWHAVSAALVRQLQAEGIPIV